MCSLSPDNLQFLICGINQPKIQLYQMKHEVSRKSAWDQFGSKRNWGRSFLHYCYGGIRSQGAACEIGWLLQWLREFYINNVIWYAVVACDGAVSFQPRLKFQVLRINDYFLLSRRKYYILFSRACILIDVKIRSVATSGLTESSYYSSSIYHCLIQMRKLISAIFIEVFRVFPIRSSCGDLLETLSCALTLISGTNVVETLYISCFALPSLPW